MLRENAAAYRGKFVLLGGIVAAALRQSGEGTVIEVLQYPLNSRELPEQVLPAGGRFLAVAHEFIDPARYKPGVLVSMMGEVAGTKVQPLVGRDYTYPVIAVKEIHALEFEDLSPPWGYLGGNGHGHGHR